MEKRIGKILTSLIAIMVVTQLEAQQQPPRLLVHITIDQLRGDYLEYFSGSMGERGFKRLMNEALVYDNVEFDFDNLDQASSLATLFTGTNPTLHGISGLKQYDFEEQRERSIFYDQEFLGNYTDEHVSPRNLLTSTIGDELKIASMNRSQVFSVAPDAEAALVSAGHAADAAFWIDSYNGKWATTTFYRNIPWFVERLNSGETSLSERLPEIEWQQALPATEYDAFPYLLDDPKIPYRYTFAEKGENKLRRFKSSPLVNKEVNRMAIEFVKRAKFGTRSCPDMLALTYYAGNFADNMGRDYTREMQDLYHHLDSDLAELFDAIDKIIGLNRTLIIVNGSGYFRSEEVIPDGLQVVAGTFHPKRCVALLNMYLMVLYGQQHNWVTGYYNNQIYLNHKAIEDSKLEMRVVQQKAADFVQEFTGVQNVTTDYSLLTGEWNEGTERFRHGTHHLRRGDLMIELQSGWLVDHEEADAKRLITRNNAVLSPLFFFGNGIAPKKVYRRINAREIAPSATHVLRIRPPNGAKELPLRELRGW